MQSKATSPDNYVSSLPAERKEPVQKLRAAILKNLPKGFEEVMSYGMIGYVVPHSMYPDGYHCNPELPLPFINLASQKNHIAVYHMGLYADAKLLGWFKKEYSKHSKAKLDMGGSCIRFKKLDQIPFELIGRLSSKITPKQWVKYYDSVIKPKS